MSRTPGTQDFAERPPWTRPGFVAAAVLVALILLAGLLIVVLAPDDDPADITDGPSPTSQPSASSMPVEGLPTVVPTTPPTGVRWELVGPMAVPVSDTAGPTQTTDTTASGFTHTPEGALIAAAQIMVRSSHALGRQRWEPTIEQQFVPSGDRDRLLAELRAVASEPTDPGSLSQIAGFSYQSYTPDTAVIGLVLRAPAASASRYHVLSLTLLWRGGDWRMQAPPGGSWLSVNRMTDNLSGVIEWGPR
ncbi:hypothetical protein GCM10029963_79950 [Micromonospora andamanensis]|uniref:hypothetical protein n=1 Tax=Micromonospora andamanensis TaxID=1287068 RepID=UPI001951AFF3|nr:hypothetical protein [Micromonospora andamanensis]GIJ40524.1 hypothetical protein Vwe01_38490 [Micromonospora andamanensis]